MEGRCWQVSCVQCRWTVADCMWRSDGLNRRTECEASELETTLTVRDGVEGVTVWSRFNALDISLYIGPCIDLWVLQGVTIIGENLSFWRLVWLSNSRVVNNTQGFLDRRKRVQLTFCKDPFVVLWQDGRRSTWLLFCFSAVRTQLTARSVIYIIFSKVSRTPQEKVKWVRDRSSTLAVAPKEG